MTNHEVVYRMSSLRAAVEDAFIILSQEGTIDLPRRVWEQMKPRAGKRDEELILDVVAGMMLALELQRFDHYENELDRLK